MINSINLLTDVTIPIKRLEIPYKEISIDYEIRDSFEIEQSDYIIIDFYESKVSMFENLIDIVVYEDNSEFYFKIFEESGNEKNSNMSKVQNIEYLVTKNINYTEKKNEKSIGIDDTRLNRFIWKLKKFIGKYLAFCHNRFLKNPNLQILCKLNLLKQAHEMARIYTFPENIFMAFVLINKSLWDQDKLEYEKCESKIYRKKEGMDFMSNVDNKCSGQNDFNECSLYHVSPTINSRKNFNYHVKNKINHSESPTKKLDKVDKCEIKTIIYPIADKTCYESFNYNPANDYNNEISDNQKNSSNCDINITKNMPNANITMYYNKNPYNSKKIYLQNLVHMENDFGLFRMKKRIYCNNLGFQIKSPPLNRKKYVKNFNYEPEVIRYIYNSISDINFIYYLINIIQYLHTEDIITLYNAIDVPNYNMMVYMLYSIAREFEARKKYKLGIRFYYLLKIRLRMDVNFIKIVNYKIEMLSDYFLSRCKDKNLILDKNNMILAKYTNNCNKVRPEIKIFLDFSKESAEEGSPKAYKDMKTHYFVSDKLLIPKIQPLPKLLNLRITSSLRATTQKNDIFQYIPDMNKETSHIFHTGKFYFEAEFTSEGFLSYLEGIKIYNPCFETNKKIDFGKLFEDKSGKKFHAIDKEIFLSGNTGCHRIFNLENQMKLGTEITEETMKIPLYFECKNSISVYIETTTSIKIRSLFLNNTEYPIKPIYLFYIKPKNRLKIIDVNCDEIIFKFVSSFNQVSIIFIKGVLFKLSKNKRSDMSQKILVARECVFLDTSCLYIANRAKDFEMLFQIDSDFYEVFKFKA